MGVTATQLSTNTPGHGAGAAPSNGRRMSLYSVGCVGYISVKTFPKVLEKDLQAVSNPDCLLRKVHLEQGDPGF